MSITGGDWRVAGTTQSRYIDARQPDGMVQEVAWCGQCEYGDNIDNARLLCAAPDLLEALEGMVSLFPTGVEDEGSGIGFNENLKSKYRAAIMAITKARGQL
jgi:hypothetical protein